MPDNPQTPADADMELVDNGFVALYLIPSSDQGVSHEELAGAEVVRYLRAAGFTADCALDYVHCAAVDDHTELLEAQAPVADVTIKGLSALEALFSRLIFQANELGLRGYRLAEVYRDHLEGRTAQITGRMSCTIEPASGATITAFLDGLDQGELRQLVEELGVVQHRVGQPSAYSPPPAPAPPSPVQHAPRNRTWLRDQEVRRGSRRPTGSTEGKGAS